MAGVPKTNGQSAQRLVDLAQLTAADFEPLLHSNFDVDLNYYGMAVDSSPLPRDDVYPPGSEVELELVEVTRRTRYTDDAPREPFTILLRGSHEVPLYGDVHVLVHPTLGRLALLLSPVHVSPGTLPENNPDGRFYECVIT